MKSVKIIGLGIALSILTFGISAFALDETLKTVESRSGVEQTFVLTKLDSSPVASVILIAGGNGVLGLSSFFGSPRFGSSENNFVVRTRDQYAKHSFLVATIDAPSDRKKMNAKWRMGKKHAADVSAVIAYLKRQVNVPVWVVGTSMGSFSAANMGIRLKGEIEGIVLTSSVTRSRRKWKIYDDYPKGVISMNLAKVTGPVFVVSHEDDQCRASPAADIQRLAKSFSNSKRVEYRTFSGGDSPISESCHALSQHGFLGIESQVVDAIAAFVKAN
jgi:pimeloyl-ACP methyl ester carboxylesterase